MKILIGCERSGIVREAFRRRGHDAWSCDIVPADDNSPFHYQCDVRELFKYNFDLFIAHPPCTRLCNSGVRWLSERDLTVEMIAAALFFKQCLNAPYKMIAVENPIMHKYGRLIIEVPYSQIIQPWQFGHPETKSTCLWLKYLPNLKPTRIVKGRNHRIHEMSPSSERSTLRSLTYPGIAAAMAVQWGKEI